MTDHLSPPDSPVRVRMAPSPTGFFHVGSARTALFNYLFAKNCGGSFVLRIEDTDMQRNDPAFEQIIYDGMAWLGLTADEGPQQGGAFGPYRQSERFALYTRHAQAMLEAGTAYLAYETADELTAMKAEQAAQKLPPRYNGAHRALTLEQRQRFESEGRKPVIRALIPDGETSWDDMVRGKVCWQNKELDDFVITKSDGSPTYNFACTVDDALMQISHVIRGEDGLSNTPRQLLLYHALGLPAPKFAHLPFLLGRDRSKLSKRHGAVNLLDYSAEGILPEAMFNYLALLGWNPGGGETQELFSRQELTERFSLAGVNKAGAIFDVDKLHWVNVQYLKTMPLDQFELLVRPHLEGVDQGDDPAYAQAALDMARERIRTPAEIREAVLPFFTDDYAVDAAGASKHLVAGALPRMEQLRERLAALPAWDHDTIEAAVRQLATDLECKPAELIHPARMAVSGRTVGPSVFELLTLLGRERVLRRLHSIRTEG